MKIGIDARMYGTGFTGIGRYTYELIHNLAKIDSGHEYVVFLRKEAYESFKLPGVNFKKVLADFSHYSFGEQFGFLKILNKEKLDLMHFTHFNAPIFYRRPFVVTIHDLTLSFFPGKKMTTVFHRLAYYTVVRTVIKNSKRIISVSNNTKKDIIKLFKIKESKIQVVYNGVNTEFLIMESDSFEEITNKLSINNKFFLYTGVWRSHKNVIGMIKAFSTFNKKFDNKYDLVITGRNNPIYHEIPDLIKELKLEKNVHLVGLVSEKDLVSLYKNAISYVFPSFYEGFGIPPLEAMQCSTPVIASNVSAIPEVCGEGNVLFFDPYNVDDIADKMEKIVSDTDVRQKLIENGLRRVKDFNWYKMTKDILQIYNSQ